MATAEFDIVIYGASGFTGRQAAHYLAQKAPAGLRWAVAGRRREAIEAVAAETGAAAAIAADSSDPESVSRMVSRCRVVVTTAGPYSKYGTPVVDACVEHRRDYVDITGETPWVKSLIDRYHRRAADDGTRIVPFCGFDSVPADIGTLMMAEYFRERGDDTRRVSAAYQISGGLNGGTLDTMITAAETGAARMMSDPFLLNPEGFRTDADPDESRDLRAVVRDDTRQTWLAPFVMAQINSRVVRRSNALYAQFERPYGPRFVYGEAMETSKRYKALAVAGILAGIEKLVKKPLGRKFLQRLGPSPGEGPSETSMSEGRTRVRYLAESSSGERALATWSYPGDPGNRFTVMSLCEAALLLATQPKDLPGAGERGGILTPATALGLPHLERLKNAGLRVEIGRPVAIS